MFNNFIKNIFQYHKWFITGTASILSFFSTDIHANNTADSDIELWLKEPIPEANIHTDGTYYFTSDDEIYLSSTGRYTILANPHSNKKNFGRPAKKTYKTNEKKLLRKLSEKLNVSLFRYKGYRNKNNIHVNLAKREIVSKNNFYGLKYEIRLSEKASKIRLRYRF